jgi:phage terminase Nu1 subunit (DNA packaging protein)
MLSDLEIQRIADAVAAKLGAAPAGGLITKDELARQLKVSPATITRSVRRGMPVEYVGDLPRFDAAACRAWLHDRAASGRRAPAPSVSEGLEAGVRKIERVRRARA